MATDVQVPALGESITEGTLAQWLKKPGEAVAQDEPIASLETDKVSVEVPSPVAGVMSEQLVKEGDTVAVGAPIARIDESGTAAAPAKAAAEATTNPPGAGETPALKGDSTAPVAEAEDDQVTTLSPAVRRAVLEYHVDPSKIQGTGKDGRLTKDDVIAAAQAGSTPAQAGAQAEAKLPSTPVQQSSAPGPRPSSGDRREERVKMSRLRQTIAKRLKDAQNTAAMLTTFNDVDMSAVIDARTRYK
ncbi:MAG TPA: biotin/lipoyl-containing protein, partial [Sphingomicrobium sp.]|nr:biotin/lipoyl-containing protein [Sphingomicrobium sp.]